MNLLYPWFLLGLLGIAFPVLVHLLQLRRPQRLLFTNLAFLQEFEMVAVRHRTVQRWLLLTARVLTIIGLVVMFCQPFIPALQKGKLLAADGLDVLIDNSYSMQLSTNAGEGRVFDKAVESANSLGGGAPKGSRIRLINHGDGMLTPAVFQARVSELALSHRLPTKNNVFESVTNESIGSLYTFSDFQKTAFSARSFNDLYSRRRVVMVPLVGEKAANMYVDSMWVEDAVVRARTNTALRVRVRNGGTIAAVNCPVKVFIGAQQVAAFRVNIEPGRTTTVLVQVQVPDVALVTGRVVTEDVPVTFDNTYFFTLQPVAGIRVLEIGLEPVAQRLYANEPLFSYSYAKAQNVDYGIMRRANMVLVREVEDVDAGLRDGLRAVVKQGGSVVVVPPAREASRGSYQRLFKDLGLGGVQWEATVGAPELRAVAMPNGKEPFFREVFGAQQRAVTMPRVAPVLRWSRTGADILRLEDGESYLASFASGAGQVYVFSAPFAATHADFVTHSLFVPVLYRMAMLSYRAEQLPAYRLDQKTVVLTLSAGLDAGSSTGAQVDEASFRLVKDSVTLIPGQRVLGQEVRLDLPVGMEVAGFYQVQRRGKVLTTLAFNSDKQESELAAYSADDLRRMIGPNRPNIEVLEGAVSGSNLAAFQQEQTGRPLWRYFLAFALVCLLAEAVLVRFGGQRGRSATAGAVG